MASARNQEARESFFSFLRNAMSNYQNTKGCFYKQRLQIFFPLTFEISNQNE